MNTTSQHKNLSFSIIFAALLIAASLTFFGLQVRQGAEKAEEQRLQTIKEEILAELRQEESPQVDQETPSEPQDREALVQQIKEEVLTELQNGQFLPQQIEAGIQNFVLKQREAQAQVQAERERIANEKAKNVRRVSLERDHIYGDPEALISLIEYSDFECPFCKTFHVTAREIVEAYDGKVNWVYRHYPLQFHNPGAQKQAEATECANELGGNESFWKYADLIYERTTSNGKGFPIENLLPLAEEIGLDRARFQACLESGKYTELVQEDFQEGTRSGITGTPGSILLNNTTGEVKLKSGALPGEVLKAEIDQMLK